MPHAEAERRRRTKAPEERRREILDAALRLFRERGFDETTVQDIADAASVATGTVYLYFPSKEHILLGIHEEFERGLEARFAEVAAGFAERHGRGEEHEAGAVVDEVFDALMGYSLQRREVWEVMCRYIPRLEASEGGEERALEREHARFLGGVFKVGTEAGLIRASDPEMLGYLLGAINIEVGRAIAFGDPPDLDRLIAQAKELYYKALVPEPEDRSRAD